MDLQSSLKNEGRRRNDTKKAAVHFTFLNAAMRESGGLKGNMRRKPPLFKKGENANSSARRKGGNSLKGGRPTT